MRVIGLTGGIGSGKSYVADRFAELGAAIVDTDAIAHEITAPGGAAIPKLVEAFGPGILRADGAMDRDAMRALAFSDATAKTRLEQITHPLIREIGLARGAAAQASGACAYLVYVVPLLVESLTGHQSWRALVDRILVVDCPVQTQIDRVMARNGLPRAQVEAIIARQATREARLAAADDVIDNGGTLADLAPQIARLDQAYRAT
ncbi:dephospho-CoA kinase [uncultured Ralstonia sp.]|jgi:dephospho-CoA kinase|uniref:dephospho-CoA kinase n=1 Tax=uncultured Ralstonia sp. TaxID=114715 RepID=UPI001EA92395|nr:dephospho-CoA kinase [uncultured Ralstonia sp.]UCF22708.1 MAG: dephospho-CoA kinase [Ralstonia sp.]